MHLQFQKTLFFPTACMARWLANCPDPSKFNLQFLNSNILNVLTEQSFKNQGVVKKKQHTCSSSSVASVIFLISFFGITRK